MTTYFWGAPPGVSGSFDSANDWFNAGSQTFGNGIPGAADIVNVVGAVPIPPAPPVHIVLPPGSQRTISQLRVLFQSVDEDFVWIEGSLRVLGEVFFENDRGNLRFIGTLALDGAMMDVDHIHVGGSQILSARNVVAIDDDGMFRVVGSAHVTTRRLEVLGTGGFEISNGATVEVAGPVFFQQGAGGPTIVIDGTNSTLLVLPGNGSNGDLVISDEGTLSIRNGGRVEVQGAIDIDQDTFEPAVSVVGSGSELRAHGDLLLDGHLKVEEGARLRAEKVIVSSNDLANLIVEDASGKNLSASFTATQVVLGDGQGGFGSLLAQNNAQVRIKSTLTLRNPITDASSFSGALATSGTGWIDIGPRGPETPDIQPNTIQVNPDGLTVGLSGHGLVDAGVLHNDGFVGAQGGLLLVDADVEGRGYFLVADDSALEIDGAFGSAGTVALTGKASKVILDAPESFNGLISALDAGDTIQLNDAGTFFANQVESVVFGPDGHGQTILRVFQQGALFPLDLRIAGTSSLANSRFAVSETADHQSTLLTLTGQGTTIAYDLDAQGRIILETKWGDGQGDPTKIYRHLGNAVGPPAQLEHAPNYRIVDLTNQQLNRLEQVFVNSDGESTTSLFTATQQLAPLGALVSSWLPGPTSVALTGVHNLLRAFRLPSSFDFTYTDGSGSSMAVSALGGLLSAYKAFEVSLGSSMPGGQGAAFASMAAAPEIRGSSVSQKVTSDGIVDFVSITRPTGFVERYQRLADGTYSLQFLEPDGKPHSGGIFTGAEVARKSVDDHQYVGSLHLPLASIGPGGVLGQNSTATYLDANGQPLITDHGAALVGQDGASSPQGASGTLVPPVVARIIAEHGSGIVGDHSGGLVGEDGASFLAALLGVVSPNGGTLGALGSGGAIPAGVATAFGVSGKATPGRYLASSLVFADANGDGVLNNGEAWDVTDGSGHFELFMGWGSLVLTGGTDTGTGLPFKGTLTAPVGSTAISALSALADGLAQISGDIDGSIGRVQAAMGLDKGLDFTLFDPIAGAENGDAASAKIHVEMSKTMDAVVLIGSAFAGLGVDQGKAQQAAFAAMVDVVDKSGTLDLSNKGTILGLVAAVGAALGADGSKIADALAGTIVSTGQLIDKLLVDDGPGAALTGGITMIETGVQGGLASSLKAAAGDPGKLGPVAVLLQASSDDGNNVVTPSEVVTIIVTTSETVTVTGTPVLVLSNGKAASFVGGSGSNSLTFKYTAKTGDGAGGLDVSGLSLGAGGSIKDVSGNALAGAVAADLGLTLDGGALVTIAVLDAVKAEGSTGGPTAFTFGLTRTGDSSVSHSVSWSIVSTGTFGGDVQDFVGGTLNGGTVTFAVGETSKTITVEVMADTGVEPDEDFLVSLANPSARLAIGVGSAAGKIVNDDATVSIAVASAVQAEGSGGPTAFTFTLAMRGDISVAHSFSYAVTGSGPIQASASDFAGGALTTGTVTFAAGESARTLTIEVLGDTTMEADEGFTVTLSDPSTGLVFGAVSAMSTIQNDDGAVVSIAALSAAKAEEHSGTTAFTFTVTLGQAAAIAQSVDWAVAGTGEHPANGADFAGGVLPVGMTTFAAGETSKTVTVAVSGDTAVEFDDFFSVTLSNPSAGLALGTASAIGIIQNDDRATISVSPLSANAAEGNGGATSFTFSVSLDQASTTSQTANWAVTGSGPNATDAADFGGALPSGTVTFAAGETTRIVTISVSGDTAAEFDEDFTVTLSALSSGLLPGTATATGTIQNDDRPVVSIIGGAATQAEGNAGTTAYTFTVSLDRPAVSGQSVDWAVTGSGANPVTAADFGGALPSGSLSFAAGETSKVVTLNVSGDTVVEFDEGLVVTLSNPSAGVDLGTATRTGTIANDDGSTVSIAAQSAVKAEGNSGTSASTFVISLSQAGVTTQTLGWAVMGSGANPASGADFAGGALPGGTVTFAPGETSKTATVTIVGDTIPEPDEGYSVTLSNPSSGLVVGVASAAGTIQNDDTAVALAAHNDAYVVLQGQSLTATASVLSNDVAATTATLLSGPAHGSLQLAGNGAFTYAPASGFVGIDSFTYRAGNGGSAGDGQVHLHVVPVNVGASTTLNLLTLTADEQIASTYAAFFGRGADLAGFDFWVGEFNRSLPTQGAAALFANIANSFGISTEAKALYPFLANPFGATDGQISAFLDSVYNNLFNRSSDAAGLGYWTDQIKQTLQAGQFVGSILVNIMSGAQDTAAGKDITTLMGKVAVSLAFVREQEEHHTVWVGTSDSAAATTLLQGVTADPQTVLVGVRNAENLIAAHA